MRIKSSQIIYSEHEFDECFEYKDGKGRVPDGNAIGYLMRLFPDDIEPSKLVLFDDIQYSQYDHQYWDNYELEQDPDRLILP